MINNASLPFVILSVCINERDSFFFFCRVNDGALEVMTGNKPPSLGASNI
jgi:hypothetical protein